ncbi:DUF4998 domain-containing protein [Mariniflexile litorale]|uniref:DUF4998 domain-containing protein n=1 Tax=Mariniflexile litorale TaxID=3045158 RepID=A0AAU7EHU5_9FLAO|nr:DUF4998 domain-containing protein [Mariniflexile sp. KMM 9835]MDQ8210684.1 DUF4998 domain-containing protein [Mariniflexile sp. KMM 9835]
MMKYILKKYYLQFIVVVALATSFGACSTMDEGYKEFLKDGEISYTGKIDSLHIFSGRNRVNVKGLFISDPKITECRIFWNSGSDSIVVPVVRTQGVDTLDVFIENLAENIYSFEVRTYDALGNISIAVSSIGSVFGDNYQASLYNRPYLSSSVYKGDANSTLKVEYGNIDLSTGVVGTQYVYTDVNDEEHVTTIPLADPSALPYYKKASSFKYRTTFLPNETAIDTFYVEYVTVDDVELVYVLNREIPFVSSDKSGRWGNLTDWTTNDAAKNHGGYGGWDSNSTGVFNIESGWGSPSITNGKVYQTLTLEAGNYKFKCSPRAKNGGIDSGYTIPEDFVYLAVAEGTDLPDSNAGVLETDPTTLGFVRFEKTMTPDMFEIMFTLTETKTISFGISTTQGQSRFCVIESFSLEKL